MEGYLKSLGSLVLLLLLLVAALLVFARVRADYQSRGSLSRLVAILQVGYFCAYALSSYAFLDSRLSHIGAAGLPLVLAIVLMIAGVGMVALSMPFLGRQSFGSEIGDLRTTGIYRYSRNPQLVGGFLFIIGYALLWPSWPGAAWALLWIVIARLMVQGEEAHLEKTFGDGYRDYCARTPRYFGIPSKPAPPP